MNPQLIDELSILLEHIDCRFDFLIGVVYRKVLEGCTNNKRCLQVLRTSQDIQDYVSHHELDMVILTCPEHMPVVLNRTELGWVKHTKKLADWITEHWKSELLLIAVS